MEDKKVSSSTLDFLSDFAASFDYSSKKNESNAETMNSALIYEKFRNAVEYQEDHLIFKNAVSRIIRRKYTLAPNISEDQLMRDLLAELAWVNYLNQETLAQKDVGAVSKALARYLVLLKNARSSRISKIELNKIIINWLACEIDEILKPGPNADCLVDYTYSVLSENMETKGVRLTSEDNEIQLKLAIFILVFKPDQPLIEYWLLKKIYPKWRTYSAEEAKVFSRSFDPYHNKVNRILCSSYRSRYLVYTKRNIAPFILMKSLPLAKGFDTEKLKTNPRLLVNWLMEIYDSSIMRTREKVLRGTIRALIFIFLTKISLAFLLEVPFDRFLSGGIQFPALAINILLPPALMLASGMFVKSPAAKNKKILSEAIGNIAVKNKINDSKFLLARGASSGLDQIFNSIYWLISIFILVGVIWLLRFFQFNFLSIILFFLFVSAVSFFSFRIRNIALELAMTPGRNDTITSTVEFAFSPFIRIGKYISERISRSNPFIFALDFLIEAPFKTILKIFNSWLKFVNAKKEEIDL